MNSILHFKEILPRSLHQVGGKGLSLGLMAGAGLPVPEGFCITTDAYRHDNKNPLAADCPLAQEILAAYRSLGCGLVAVRSSATAEDGAATSFAGQQETILGVGGENALLEAVRRCWASLDSERAMAYRQKQGMADDDRAMAVVVQKLVPADVAGVLFTTDPLDPEGRQMLVEASWGLGESVVSGRVTPDRFNLDRHSGAVMNRHINAKTTQVTAAGQSDVPYEKQNQACLGDAQLQELAALGRRVVEYYGDSRDIEWALAAGKFWVLQARPITTISAAERESLRREEVAALQAKANPEGTVWSRYNLAEILPEPTPMTWAIVRRFMSGSGGFGLMYRDLGFQPDPAIEHECVYDLVCGRPFCNLSREPLMYANGLPLEHVFTALKAQPDKALYPQATLNWARAGWRFWLFFPASLWRGMRVAVQLQKTLDGFSTKFREQVIRNFVKEVDAAGLCNLRELESPALLEQLEHWIQRTLCDFARESLKPTVIAAWLMGNVEKSLTKSLGAEPARRAIGQLTLGAGADADANLSSALRDLAEGRLEKIAFLKGFGHRCSQEMELAQMRWSEDPAQVDRMMKSHGSVQRPVPAESTAQVSELLNAAGLAEPVKTVLGKMLDRDLPKLKNFLGLRETAKHYLMKGYAEIRRILVTIDLRFGLQGGIFYLVPDELRQLASGKDFSKVIAERRRRRAIALSFEVPQTLFSDDLEAIGRPIIPSGADTLQGVPLSAGVAEGPALVLETPNLSELPNEPYILVCPSTDPAWVPLFLSAKGLVMETGGVLSHGAIVAREFGLPAVAGLPGIQRRLKSGQMLRVDGATGNVSIHSLP